MFYLAPKLYNIPIKTKEEERIKTKMEQWVESLTNEQYYECYLYKKHCSINEIEI